MPASVPRRLPAPARQPRNTKRFLLITVIASLGLLLALSHALAAVSLSTTTPATQNFDSIGTAAAATLPADFRADKLTAARTVGTYSAAGTATANVGGANLGSSASNGIYNFGSGTTTTGGSDRAVGFLASSGGTTSGNLYAQLANNTGGPLTGLQISYDVEKYRGGTNSAGFRIQLFYSFDGTTWTSAGSNFLTSFTPDATTAGYATAPGATVSVTNQALNVAVPAGSNIYLAWNYSVNGTGSTVTNAQALAVDNISILAVPDTTATPTPTTPTPTATPTATPTPTPTPTPTNPAATGSANPNSLQAGSSTVLTVNVTPGANPASTGVSVSADLSSIGGLSSQPFSGSGNTFTYTAGVAPATTPGVKSLPVTVADAQGRSARTSISLTVEQPPPPPDHVVISQVYGGGGNTDATYTNDYVELYNPTSSPVTLTGWSIQYGAATGSTWTNKQPLGGDIGPGQYYLVQLASGGANGQPLPVTPNITGDINMSAAAGKVALVSNGDSLTGGACPVGTDPDIVDFVGYGTTANCREG
ncbi:MAG: lamin tail domain-containing protein, partial [Acidobacteriota bacterium]|nr:lamin tail domain-containing protein [Acidobacteriota bacterium]